MAEKSNNLIYIVSIDHHTSNNKCSDYSKYCLKTWEYWCKKNGVDLIVCTEHDKRFGRPIWNKEKIYEIGKNYNKIGIIDSDTMVKWDTPNIFNDYGKEFCGVVDTGDFRWILDSIKVYKRFFPDVELNVDNYFNAGVLFFHNSHLKIFEELLNLYLDNKEVLDNWKQGGGKEQTLLNYIVNKNNIKLKPLLPNWNLLGLHKKDMFKYNWQLNRDTTPFFIKYGYIWHFTGLPVEQRKEIMGKTWDLIKENYE